MKNSPETQCRPFPEFVDERGSLVVWEHANLPFNPCRTFMISNVPQDKIRGNHAVDCDLFITAVKGSVVLAFEQLQEILLNKKSDGFHVEKNTFFYLKNFTDDAIVLVFAEKPHHSTTYKTAK